MFDELDRYLSIAHEVSLQTLKRKCRDSPKEVFDLIDTACRKKYKASPINCNDLKIVEHSTQTLICQGDEREPRVVWNDSSLPPTWCVPDHPQTLFCTRSLTWENMPQLPSDIIEHIFMYLPVSQYIQLRFLSRKWKTRIEDNHRWKSVIRGLKTFVSKNMVAPLNIKLSVPVWNSLPYWKQFINYVQFGFHSQHVSRLLTVYLDVDSVNNLLIVLSHMKSVTYYSPPGMSPMKALLQNYTKVLKQIGMKSIHELYSHYAE